MLLLLLASWMFLFPFVWMLATSVKTDEELLDSGILPQVEHFHPEQPVRARAAVEPIRPTDVTLARWEQMTPDTAGRLAGGCDRRYQKSHPPAAGDGSDRSQLPSVRPQLPCS